MTNLRQAARQALDTLANARDYIYLFETGDVSWSEEDQLQEIRASITALRAALTEPEQERPHPDYPCRSDGRCQYAIDSAAEELGHCPPGKCCMAARLEPTTQEIQNAAENLALMKRMFPQPEQEPVAWYFVRDTERAISFAPDNDPTKPWQPLYTAPPGDVEPVAWMVYTEGGTSAYVTDNPNDLVGAYRALPIYTAPTPRKPLTDEALHQVIRAGNYDSMEQFARAIERAHGITGETK